MQEIADIIMELCTEYQTAMYVVLAVIAILIIGSRLMIPSDESHAKAKKAIPFVILGACIIGGAITLAVKYTEKIQF